MTARYDENNRYVTEQYDGFEIVKDFQTLTNVLSGLTDGDTITVNSWDDVNIDAMQQFRKIQRTDVNNNVVMDYDMSNQTRFNFNAILLYYSVYDLDDVYKQPLATNLFGIVFLDGGTGSGDYILTPLTKKKSFMGQNNKNAYFGNSYSFRVNIKTLSVYDNTDARIDDITSSNSLYVHDFNDVISTLNRAVDMMNFNSHTVNAIQDRYMQMQSAQVELTNTVNELPSDVLKKTLDVLDVSLAAEDASVKSYVDTEIEKLKERLGIIDDVSIETINGTIDDVSDSIPDDTSDSSGNILGLSRGIQRQYVDYDEQRVNVYNQVTSMLDSFGVMVMDGIISAKKNPDLEGRYLRYQTKNKINAWGVWDGENWTENAPCTTGKLYSAEGVIYKFNGITCVPLGE